MNWLVFGDDWGAHPSTTQHLVAHLPAQDRVFWVNSLGMRAPTLTRADLDRARRRLFGRSQPPPTAAAVSRGRAPDRIIPPLVLPWHNHRLAVWIGRRSLGRRIRAELGAFGVQAPVALVSNPAAWAYLPAIPTARVAYLRLDDYPRLPGVDPALIAPLDQALLAAADRVFYTAAALAPPGLGARGTYLPQGVDCDHFGVLPLRPPKGRVLGFFGLLAEWLDLDLMMQVADAAPDWTLELLGPVRYAPAALLARPNVRYRPGVPYADLPDAIRHWDAAWLPFQLNALTDGVNPLKIREYLAAGLPTASTALPEVLALEAPVQIVATADEVTAWLYGEVSADRPDTRQVRRQAVASHSWARRAETLRDLLGGHGLMGGAA